MTANRFIRREYLEEIMLSLVTDTVEEEDLTEINELYEILESLPDKDIDNTLDKNHIYLVLKDNITEITNKEANYDKYIILNIAEDKTITWEKIETTEASGNILVLINGDEKTEATLPDIEFASTNFIYCLLTPEYQRGLNIGLTNSFI